MFTLPVAGSLPSSKTHAARRWSFLPASDPADHLGTLTVIQGKRECASYAVEVVDIGRGCSEVLLLKKDHTAEIYAVTCSRAGQPVRCSCPGFLFGQRRGIVCKHVHAVRELIEDGAIELPAGVQAVPA